MIFLHKILFIVLSGVCCFSIVAHMGGASLSSSTILMEICDNAIDDDGNGLIDLNDPACKCEELGPISYIPNPSFEEMDCCPSSFSQLNCASDWIQASRPTTDFLHTCDWMGWNSFDVFPPPQPFPDGNGIMGFRDGVIFMDVETVEDPDWKEYAGACLIQPLLADSLYKIEFDIGFIDRDKSPPINVSFFGSTDCRYLPFGYETEELVGCPTNSIGWVRLGAVPVTGGVNQWFKESIEIQPEVDIYAIAIGPDCPDRRLRTNTYYFFDNLLLADEQSFDIQVRSTSHPCKEDFEIRIEEDSSFQYQWYKEGIALIGETQASLQVSYGEGSYQLRAWNQSSCFTTLVYQYVIPTIEIDASLSLCPGETYSFGTQTIEEAGDYFEAFVSKDNCDSLVHLSVEVIGETADTIYAHIFEGQEYRVDGLSFSQAGEHFYTINSSKNCDSLILLILNYIEVVFPNVFSPNDDGSNDEFYPVFDPEDILRLELFVYDRWGSLVFKGINQTWDGRSKGRELQNGVYTFLAKFYTFRREEKIYSGSVCLIK